MSATIEALRRRATVAPAARALRGSSSEMSYAQLLERANALRRRLEAEGFRTLALAADNSVDWIVADLAAQMAGIALVPVPPFFSAQQLRHVLATSGADGLLVDADSALDVSRYEPLPRLPSTLRCFRIRHDQAPRPALHGADKISYTSGTTGEPKGVCLSMTAMEAVAASLCEATSALDLRRHLCLLPLSTLLENIAGVYAPLLCGAEINVPALRETGLVGAARLETPRLLACLHEYRPHSIILVPQMLDALVRALERGVTRPDSLRFIAVGGAHTSPGLLERADRLGLPVYEGYGLTECASVVAMNTPHARRIGSVGRALGHVRVRAERGGEIVVSGALMSGYVGEAQHASAELHTGDVGVIDEDGFIRVHGRRRNVFITSFGRNVSPEWVEAALERTATIAQAALFGEGRPWNVAVIVAAPEVCAAAIQADVDAVNAMLPDYARVGRWILARERFSCENGLLTMNGRLRRAAVQRLYRCDIDRCFDELLSRLPEEMA